MRFGRFLIRFLYPLMQLLFPFRTFGRDRLPLRSRDERLILCGNHISDFDPVFLEMCQKRHVFFMAKAELFRHPLGRWFFGRVLGAFPVERGKGDTGALDTAVSLVEQGRLLGIFPEGTRSCTGALGRAKSGAALIAARTGASVIPVAITAKGQRVRLFHKTHVRFGAPLTPEELHLQDPEHPDLRYASRFIMARIAELMREDGVLPTGESVSVEKRANAGKPASEETAVPDGASDMLPAEAPHGTLYGEPDGAPSESPAPSKEGAAS